MKAFKVKRGNETYFRVELPKQFCLDGRRKSVMAKSKADAVKKAQEEMARLERGLDRNGGDLTVQEFMTAFLAYYKTDGGIAPSTMQDYRYHVTGHDVFPRSSQIIFRRPGRIEAVEGGAARGE